MLRRHTRKALALARLRGQQPQLLQACKVQALATKVAAWPLARLGGCRGVQKGLLWVRMGVAMVLP